MKRLAFLFLLCSSALYSQTFYMNVWSNGKATSIPVQDIQKITFSNTSTAIENEQVITVIKSFNLLQNYPNPFNPGTTIEYEIPAAGTVEIRIFSINGQLVKTFENTHAASGSYTVAWDGQNDAGLIVASGFYLYRVSYANSVATKKMMFIK
jgi:hypothetical protein